MLKYDFIHLITLSNEIQKQENELHKFLESKQKFADWVTSKVINNPFFEKNQDFILLHNVTKQDSHGGHNRKDYALTIDTAKKLLWQNRQYGVMR